MVFLFVNNILSTAIFLMASPAGRLKVSMALLIVGQIYESIKE
jgi:hypothetical protein